MIERLFGLFQRLIALFKKKGKPLEEPVEKEKAKEINLKDICADDPEAFDALYGNVFFTPWLINLSMDGEAEKGHFMIAGMLAIYAGDVEKVKEYFGKDSELTGRKWKILEPGIAERAVKKAQEYYAVVLKKEEERKRKKEEGERKTKI